MRPVLAFFLFMLALPAAQITVPSVPATAGSTVTANILFAAQGAQCTGLQFDLQFDASLTISATMGAAGSAAGKSIGTSTPSPGTTRFVIAGLNQTAIGDGVVVTLSIVVPAGSTTANYTLHVLNQLASDSTGASIALTAVDGAGTVGTGASGSRIGGFAHIASGAGWKTSISLMNTTSTDASVTLSFYADAGTPQSLPMTIVNQGTTQTATADTTTQVVHPHATLLISSDAGPSANITCWADVASTASLSGFAIFAETVGSNPSQGTVDLGTNFSPSLLLPFDNTDGQASAAALANLSPTQQTVNVTARDMTGVILGTATLPVLAGNGHTAFLVPSQIPLTSANRGTVEFQTQSGTPIIGIGLQVSALKTFSSLPPIAMH